MLDLSIIIPSFNERDNVTRIVQKIHSALHALSIQYDIWFVDDSTDETTERLMELVQQDKRVHLHHRTGARGLASAVVEGFQLAPGKYFIVMDADLQHPPELLPDMFQALADGADVVIPSRFVPGGSDGGLGPIRKLISWTARMIGQVALRRLRNITDCTGGYFGLHRSVIQHAELDPIGWKILIEVLVKGDFRTVHEIPYAFLNRNAGESKMSLREQWNYVRHIMRLVAGSPEDRRFILFCIIGLSGVIVNMVVLSILKFSLHLQDTAASVIASLVAMISNYIWNDQITWSHTDGRGWNVKLPLFVGISLVGIVITTVVMKGLRWFGLPVLVGQAAGILVATTWSYLMNNRVTWKDKDKVPCGKVIVTRRSESMK